MKGLKLFAPLFLALAACGRGPQTLNVTLVDALGQPIQPVAAAWRLGPPPSTGGPAWNALPAAQSTWFLPLPSNARFQVAFRCPNVGGAQLYVSLDLIRGELGSNLVVRCPGDYGGPTASVSGTVSPALTSGTARSAQWLVSFAGASFSGLAVPTGSGREVAVFGDVAGTPYFGRTGPIVVPPATLPPITVSLTGTLNVSAPHPSSYAGLVLSSSVPVDLANWGSGLQAVARPGNLSGGDLFQFYSCHGVCCGILRKSATDPAVASGNSLTLPTVPMLTLTVSETHALANLPTFTLTTPSGFSAGLNFLGHGFLLAVGGGRYWRHFVSSGALGSGSTYYVDVENAPGFSGIIPGSGASVALRAAAFAGDQPLSAAFAANPMPTEILPTYSMFLDRMLPMRLEVVYHQSIFSW